MDNTFLQEKLLPRLTFNPGLAIAGFQRTLPWFLIKFFQIRFSQSVWSQFFEGWLIAIHRISRYPVDKY